ncbi:hypothetical protein CEXT_485351 [Caerostris extrusa]|uniref:Uncharacterized protein n=1 Tax=Caerostris extrusa TaxID=172846 RepID=A0AAV4TIU3_CAEEX|nr:hypothetical protein CEXT_485351 [Caerostris extrusa]
MQDGAPQPIAKPVMQLLMRHFGNDRIISSHFSTTWLERSPDLSFCDLSCLESCLLCNMLFVDFNLRGYQLERDFNLDSILNMSCASLAIINKRFLLLFLRFLSQDIDSCVRNPAIKIFQVYGEDRSAESVGWIILPLS